MVDLIKEFKVLRRDQGFSQKHLAKGTGVSEITVYTWEAHTREPTIANFNKVLNKMGYQLKIEPIDQQTNASVQQVV